jgi:hypothetical protein
MRTALGLNLWLPDDLDVIAVDAVAVIVAIAVLVTFILHLVGPVVIWTKARLLVPEWETPGRIEVLPGDVRPYFEASDRALVACGFSLAAVAGAEDPYLQVMKWLAIYQCPGEKTWAMPHVQTRLDPGSRLRPMQFVSFVTEFADGQLAETGNSGEPEIVPWLTGLHVRQFPGVKDLELLFKIHLARTAQLSGDRRDLPAAGRELAHVTAAVVDHLRLYVGIGYFREVEPGRLYRPTVKGAVLMTWRFMPPLGWINRVRRWWRNRAFLAKHHLRAG